MQGVVFTTGVYQYVKRTTYWYQKIYLNFIPLEIYGK